MKIFNEAELKILSEMQHGDMEYGIDGLSELDLLRLKSGENVTLSLITTAKALLASYENKQHVCRFIDRDELAGYITRGEMKLLLEEHNNLAVRVMLMYEALLKRGVITDKEIREIAADMRGDANVGSDDSTGQQEGAGEGAEISSAKVHPISSSARRSRARVKLVHKDAVSKRSRKSKS